MAGDPRVLGLLEEMLNSGKTPEEVCRHCPELLPEVRRRWQQFQLVDAQVRSLLPGLETSSDAAGPRRRRVSQSHPRPSAVMRCGAPWGRAASAPSTSGTIRNSTGPWPSRCCTPKRAGAGRRIGPAGGAAARPAASPRHRGGPRRGHARGAGLHRLRLPRRPRPRPVAARPPPGLAGGGPDRGRRGRRARPRACPTHHPPRRQAGEHPPRRRPRTGARGLRPGPRRGPGGRRSEGRRRRHSVLHVAGAGGRHGPPHRRPHRRLQPGRGALRNAHRRVPFRATDRQELLRQVRDDEPQPPRQLVGDIPPELGRACLKALAKRQEDRYTTAGDFAADLRRVLPTWAVAELTGPRSGWSASPPISAVKRHSVGRQKELAELGRAFESAAAGQGLFLCVTGEPGIGKTTLVEDFLSELAATGRLCALLRALFRCLAGTEAYLPFLEALESLLHDEVGEAAARVMKATAPNWYAQVVSLTAEDSSLTRVLAESKAASQERLKRELVPSCGRCRTCGRSPVLR